MPCSDPSLWQPQHPGGAIWLREGENTREGRETIKMGCVSLIVLSIKVLEVRPQQGSHAGPITRHWRADGTSTSSCGGLLKWLTTGYHLKYSIINAWVQLFPSLALEPVHFRESAELFLKDLNGWSLALTGQDSHCWSLHFSPLLYLVQMALYSSLIFCTLIFNTHSMLTCIVSTFWNIHIKSCKFFNHLIYNSHFILFFKFSFIASFLHCSHFEVQHILKDALLQTNPSGFPSESTCLVFLNCLLLFAGG